MLGGPAVNVGGDSSIRSYLHLHAGTPGCRAKQDRIHSQMVPVNHSDIGTGWIAGILPKRTKAIQHMERLSPRCACSMAACLNNSLFAKKIESRIPRGGTPYLVWAD